MTLPSPLSRVEQAALPFCSNAIAAELRGDDVCVAFGVVARSSTPVLNLCRQLVAAGHDPTQPLEAWRDDTLCLRVRSIGEAAAFEIDSHGRGFRPLHNGGWARPMRQNGRGAA
jgi:hypothetical protein